jgi:hypothetical protein
VGGRGPPPPPPLLPMMFSVALAAFLIGFNKAGVAGTLGPFVTVLLALSIPADDAIGLLLPILIVADWFTLAAHWRQWDVRIYSRLLLASLIGILIGSLVISAVDETALRRIIAVAMLGFAIFYLKSRSIRHDQPAESAELLSRRVVRRRVDRLDHVDLGDDSSRRWCGAGSGRQDQSRAIREDDGRPAHRRSVAAPPFLAGLGIRTLLDWMGRRHFRIARPGTFLLWLFVEDALIACCRRGCPTAWEKT